MNPPPRAAAFQMRCKQRDSKRCLVWAGMCIEYVVTKVSLTCDRLLWFHSGCIIIRCLWRRCCGRCCNPRRLEPSNFHSPGGSRNASWSLTKIWNSGQCHTSVVKSWQCSMLCHSCRKPEPQPKWVVTQQRQHPKVFPTQGLRCQTNSIFLGFQQWEGDTLLSRMETRKGMVLSQWSLATPACVLSVRCWWSIWTGLLHQLHSNWRDWQDIELAQVRIHILPAWQNLFNALLILARSWSGTGNMILDCLPTRVLSRSFLLDGHVPGHWW